MKRREFLGPALLLAGCGSSAPPPVEEPAAEALAPEAAFVPAGFQPPTEVDGDGFVLVPLSTPR